MNPDETAAPALPEATPQADAALATLLEQLTNRGYHFVTPTPATHARVIRRPDKQRASNLRDVFGWSLPFDPDLLDSDLLSTMRGGGVIAETADGLRSRVRVSSACGLLFLHSAFPTSAEDAVFFGPDSYRFARFIEEQLGALSPGARMVDVGAGAGVGGIVAGRARPAAKVLLTDVNPKALRLARINAAHAGVAVELVETAGLDGLNGLFDAILINPPYIIDNAGRAYRDGGGMHGARMAFDLAAQSIERLAPGGRLLLYTGSPIVEGRDELREALDRRLAQIDCDMDYRELDPDVFGEELAGPEYAEVERIPVVGALITRRP